MLEIKGWVLAAVLGSGIATYFTRFPFMLLSTRVRMPAKMVRYMKYIAPAVFTSLIVPIIFTKQGKLDFSLSNMYIPAAVITVAVAWLTRNMLVTVIAGICAVGGLMWLM